MDTPLGLQDLWSPLISLPLSQGFAHSAGFSMRLKPFISMRGGRPFKSPNPTIPLTNSPRLPPFPPVTETWSMSQGLFCLRKFHLHAAVSREGRTSLCLQQCGKKLRVAPVAWCSAEPLSPGWGRGVEAVSKVINCIPAHRAA